MLNDLKIEFYAKNQDGNMEVIKTLGEGKRTLRLINGFPFTPKTVNILMKTSDPFVLMTGDQSLSEAISNNKIFLYQTMWWKQPLYKNLLTEVGKVLGYENPLYIFLAMQEKAFNEGDMNKISTYLKENDFV